MWSNGRYDAKYGIDAAQTVLDALSWSRVDYRDEYFVESNKKHSVNGVYSPCDAPTKYCCQAISFATSLGSHWPLGRRYVGTTSLWARSTTFTLRTGMDTQF